MLPYQAFLERTTKTPWEDCLSRSAITLLCATLEQLPETTLREHGLLSAEHPPKALRERLMSYAQMVADNGGLQFLLHGAHQFPPGHTALEARDIIVAAYRLAHQSMQPQRSDGKTEENKMTPFYPPFLRKKINALIKLIDCKDGKDGVTTDLPASHGRC